MLLDAGAQHARALAVDDVDHFSRLSVAPSIKTCPQRGWPPPVSCRARRTASPRRGGRWRRPCPGRGGAFSGFSGAAWRTSRTLTLSFSAPACTVSSPLLSGAVKASPRVLSVRSMRLSPGRMSAGAPPSSALAGWMVSALASSAFCNCARRLCSSCSFTVAALLRFNSEMTCSASRCAFCSMRRASSLAFLISVSRRLSSCFCSLSASSRSFCVS